MKAILSNRIILDVDKDLAEKIVTELTYKIPSSFNKGTAGPEIIKTFGRIKDNIFSIPSGRLDLIPKGHEIIDKRLEVPVDFPAFKGSLRDSQKYVYDNITGTAIINAPPSWGKTFTAIAIAAKFGQKTLILTHTTMLRDQWAIEIEKSLGIKSGIIGSSKFKIGDIITVGNVQTVSKRIADVADVFGTIIVDECHHTPATTFSTIVDKCKAKYKIGLSGTLERKDRKHVIFNDYFGFELFKPEEENRMTPEVIIVKTDIILPGAAHWADKVTELENFTPKYRDLVVELTDSAVKNGHKVLVVGGRVEFLEKCAEQVKANAGVITGKVKDLDERIAILNAIESGDIDALFGTCSIFAEGISQNDLSCLILATPINNDPMLTQLIGRIVRLKEGKQQPLVIDINLKGGQAANQARGRYSLYLRKGYRVRVLDKSS